MTPDLCAGIPARRLPQTAALLYLISCLGAAPLPDRPPTPVPPATPEGPVLQIPAATEPGAGVSEPPAARPSATESEPQRLDDASTNVVRSLVLLLLPRQFDDEDGWGRETRIMSGLDTELDGLRLETRRRWKSVNHGSWKRGRGDLVDPASNVRLSAWVLPADRNDTVRYRLRSSARLHVTGQQQQWNYGVMLWSVSADAVADITLEAEFHVRRSIVTAENGVRIQLHPHVDRAALQLTDFSLRRVSNARGPVIREFGEWAEGAIRRRVEQEGRNLSEKINRAIARRSDRFQLTLGGTLFGSGAAADSTTEDTAPAAR